jgi:DHA1 family bicyclomycin/chloramphenicol resistance-like MFS transporter
MPPSRPPNPRLIIVLLGALSIVSPFSIDLYLPAFSHLARDFGTTSAVVSLSLSSYFIGLALGQIIYGPFLDRFGRKPPIYVGLALFLVVSVACLFVHHVRTLIILRFFQALGGGVAQVAATAMVRDFFPSKESAKVFSLVFLCIGTSPLLAPSIGGQILVFFGWPAIFLFLIGLVAVILAVTFFYLPEPHRPDPSISLRLGPVFHEFAHILRNPWFFTYAVSGAFSFAGLFTYVAGSPIIFMDGFHLGAEAYSGVFAVLTMGFIGANQLNVFLLRTVPSKRIFARALGLQALVGGVFLLGELFGVCGFAATLALFFLFLACAGLTYPNAAALALAPFSKNTGSASALLGLLQMGIGAFISAGIGLSHATTALPVIAILAATAALGLLILLSTRHPAHAHPPA